MQPTELLSGPFWAACPVLPLHFCARLGDVRPRFLPKCRVGRSYRAIARNGRVLLASEAPLEELVDRTVRLRLQVWNRAILPGDVPEPYGLLVDVRVFHRPAAAQLYDVRLVGVLETATLMLDVGGGQALAFDPDDP